MFRQEQEAVEIQGSMALVTGANRGIGRAIVQTLAARGASVLAGVRSLDAHRHVPGGTNVSAVKVDLSSLETIQASVDALGGVPIDILVNNAGSFEGGLLETQPVERIYEVLQSSLIGPIHLTRLLLPGMLQRGRGKIVNNVSIVGHAPFPGATVYAAAKTGLHGFTESLRRELDQTDLSVLELITPGVDTDMMQQVQEQLDQHTDTSGWDHVDPDDWAAKVAAAIESDKDELNPGGIERLAKLLPPALLDLTARHTFDRS
jgi:short-subunit dehydrogenase